MCFFFFFFFQAEDGIRDVERSRGLGDVYKRQCVYTAQVHFLSLQFDRPGTPDFNYVFFFFFFFSSRRRHTRCREVSWARRCVQETALLEFTIRTSRDARFQPVSYTHLTLPTILLVQISVVAVSLKKKKQAQPQIVAGNHSEDGEHEHRCQPLEHKL
eukprot:TRINITY_DN17015_c0_g1_i7.p2 TRINITY_DN17015_c0_g1~~TRINITY_DN17015_c0_g1_i7.p2  ORF type:complete len:158 (+),score=65.21 TRINITY_DN17015_c0_g1_i7:94-567(+)